MGYVYKYTDCEDNTVKYVGIVWSDRRSLERRIYEHTVLDDWCKGKDWVIEYLEVESRTDCEALEAHFISLYDTGKWYNTRKAGWGTCEAYLSREFEWKKFNFELKNKYLQSRNSRRIRYDFIDRLCSESVYIHNNGVCYLFFKTLSKPPVAVFMADSDDELAFAVENNLRYMNHEQLINLSSKIRDEGISYGYGFMPDEAQQIKYESDLQVSELYTYRLKEDLSKELAKNGCSVADSVRVANSIISEFNVSLDDVKL